MAPPKAVLFDIGGVCVVSPLQAIVDYEKANGIPPDWVNFAISRSSTTGAWQRLERGEIPLDERFFDHFRRDLHNPKVWEQYNTSFKNRRKVTNPAASSPQSQAPANPQNPIDGPLPPLPSIDGTTLFWAMMAVSRTPDPYMTPALHGLRASKRFVVGALSNTIIFPDWHPYAADNLDSKEDIRSGFDVFVSSAHVGLRKPSREIYELAVKNLDEFDRARGGSGIGAGDVLFLDDIGQNLKMAKDLGMRTIKVWLGRTDKAVEELEKETGLILSGSAAGKARL